MGIGLSAILGTLVSTAALELGATELIAALSAAGAELIGEIVTQATAGELDWKTFGTDILYGAGSFISAEAEALSKLSQIGAEIFQAVGTFTQIAARA